MARPLLVAMVLFLAACAAPVAEEDASAPAITLHDDLRAVYDSANVSGSFVLHDPATDAWTYVDSAQARVRTLPASTYKVLHTLIALETGVVTDTGFVIPWDGVHRRPEVDKDLTLAGAFRTSALWYYQEVARRVGAAREKEWLDRVAYGNADTSGGVDRFWMSGGLRVSPLEQLDLLERLQADHLPFAERNMYLTRAIMLQQDTLGYALRGKTGWTLGSIGDVGWFIGWVEHGGHPLFFANRVMTTDSTGDAIGPARRGTALALLKRLGALPVAYPQAVRGN